MRTNDEIRYCNLLALVNKRGGLDGKGLKKLVDESERHGEKLSGPTLKQVLDKTKTASGTTKGIGDELARKIELHLDLGRGWMDQDHEAPESTEETPPDIDEAMKILAVFAKLKKSDRHQVLSFALDFLNTSSSRGSAGVIADQSK